MSSSLRTCFAYFLLAAAALLPTGCNRSDEQSWKFRDPWAERRAEVQRRLAEKAAAENPDRPAPRLETSERKVDFAATTPNEPRGHAVTVSNTGDAPLEIKLDPHSTARLDVAPAQATLAPGESSEFMLTWTPRHDDPPLVETVALGTNDPRVPVLQLTATGSVLRELVVTPPSIELDRVRSDQSMSTAAFVTSEIWENFKLTDGETTLDGASWTVDPASPRDLRLLGAKSGYLVTYTVPAGMEHGRYRHALSLTAVPKSGEPQRIEMPVTCKVLRKVAVYGEGIDGDGVIRFGVQPAGLRHDRRFTVKVYDDDPDVGDVSIVAEPDYLEASFEPMKSGDGKLYQLEVAIPADAPPAVCRGGQRGGIRIEFGRPGFEPLELGVEFVTHKFRSDNFIQASAQ